jgi:hypothetical protein
MTVVVVVPGQAEPWQVANAAFRMLVDQARQVEPRGATLSILLNAEMYGTLDLSTLTATDRGEVAHALARSASRLRRHLVDQGPTDEWEAELIERLSILAMWMDGIAALG